MTTKTLIEVNLTYEGLHQWVGAETIPEVSFLRYMHRHIFHIRCRKEVSHDDRDMEFIVFKRRITEYLDSHYDHKFNGMSCEMIARELLMEFECEEVRVMEDGENGAIVKKES